MSPLILFCTHAIAFVIPSVTAFFPAQYNCLYLSGSLTSNAIDSTETQADTLPNPTMDHKLSLGLLFWWTEH